MPRRTIVGIGHGAFTPPTFGDAGGGGGADLVNYPSAALATVLGPQLVDGSALNPWPWFDTNAAASGRLLGANFPSAPPTVPVPNARVQVTAGSAVVVADDAALASSSAFVAKYVVTDLPTGVWIKDASGTWRGPFTVATAPSGAPATFQLGAAWTFDTGGNRQLATREPSNTEEYDNYVGYWQYYDQCLCQWHNYFRTGDPIFKQYAKKIARSWWLYDRCFEGTIGATDISELDAPRQAEIGGLIVTALMEDLELSGEGPGGTSNKWDWIAYYTRAKFDEWLGRHRDDPGLYFGVRDGAFMLLYAAWLAEVLPDTYICTLPHDGYAPGQMVNGAAFRTAFANDSLDLALNYHARLQVSGGTNDGAWFWWDDDEQLYACTTFQIGFLMEGLIQLHRRTGNPVLADMILRGVSWLMRVAWFPAPTRALVYEYVPDNPVLDPPPGDLRDQRQRNATMLHALGYAWKIADAGSKAQYKAWFDDAFSSTMGGPDAEGPGADGGWGLADYIEPAGYRRAKEYDQTYRAAGKGLAWVYGGA